MPPPKHRAKHAVSAAAIAAVRQWIAEGAIYQAHWAYQPLATVTPPGPQLHPVDVFVRQRLRAEGMRPAAEADRVTLLRRVHYDLLGLPPSEEETRQFLADDSPLAYEAMLDRVLGSQHFGERWGRHWLDMARYADSDGYEKDRPRHDAWRYRDWVIRAVNEDLSFDQFTIQQLAGDLLPDAAEEQVVATAFHRQTLTNTEGGTDQEQFRVEACFDRTETLGTVWLGLTVGCARCHTHKYDEITHREYFQLYAFFNNADEVTRKAPVSPEAWQAYEREHGEAARRLIPLKRKVDVARQAALSRLPEWEEGIQERLRRVRAEEKSRFAALSSPDCKVSASAGSKLRCLPGGGILVEGKAAKQEDYQIWIPGDGQRIQSLQLEVLPHESLPQKGPGRSGNGNFVLTGMRVYLVGKEGRKRELVLHSPRADFEQSGFKAAAVLDGNSQTGWAVKGGIGKRHSLVLHLADPVVLSQGESLEVHLEQRYLKSTEHSIGHFRILAAAEETLDAIAPADVRRILNEEPKRRNPVVVQALHEWVVKTDAAVQQAAAVLQAAEEKLPKSPVMEVRVMAEREAGIRRPTRILDRGEFLHPTDPVETGGLNVLPEIEARAERADRLDLARWLVSAEHPLTPRVTINHWWAQLFGRGLVSTVADFGVRGEAPSHPELLDWLAAELIRGGWSRKAMLRLIMTSATYKQSSDPSVAEDGPRGAEELEKLEERDPLNVLLWRQQRQRVQGEIVRDLYLAAAGLLSPKIGGPSVFPPMPKDIADLSYANNFKWQTSEGEDRYRRGLYTFFKRTAPHPDLTTFDCPDANVTNVQRSVSNTPLQALTTLNGEVFVEAAQALAARVMGGEGDESGAGDGVEQRLARAFRYCLTREPEALELQQLKRLYEDSLYYYQQADPEEIRAMVGSHGGEFSAERAAMVASTRILLNLDELITRD
jgi:hypothetical protein